MNENEAPEKIYLYPSDRCGEEYEAEWGDKPWGEGYVEYTRTDAFIKRIHELLSCRIEYITYYDDKTEFVNEIIEDISEDIE